MKMGTWAAILTLAIGCGGDGGDAATEDTGDGGTTPAGFDDAELAEALWDEISDYDTWGQRDGWGTEPVESGDHMGAYVVAYYNDPLLNWSFSGEAPEGSISVKEQWGHAGATGCTPACGSTGCTPTCGSTSCTPTCGTSCTPTCGTPGTGDGELVLQAFTVMKKIAGYAPDGGDWFWAMYGADGTVMEAGSVDMCVGCHTAAAADYVFGAPPQ